jgi:anti-sigma regulatory factor (Ser/Thr protein kinase)
MSQATETPEFDAARGRGPVEIRLPADAGLVSAIRLLASGMAAAARSTIDEIDDVKLAVSEVLLALIERGSSPTVAVTFELRDHAFEIIGRADSREFDPEHPDVQLSKIVLAEVCAQHSIERIDNELRITATVTLTRRHDQ